jgi:1-acyl-sn-glycerol-3-phosphate acyltransferase
MKFFWKRYLSAMGWNTDVSFPYHHLKKYIIIVALHTSNWDFVIGLGYRNLLDLNKTQFLGKKELFKAPFGFLFRKLGGIPVDRRKSSHLVEEVVNLFQTHKEFVIALSPEGTRSRVDKLKTGFYFIALKAAIPIIMVGLDYRHKTIRISDPLMATEQEKDFEQILNFYRPIAGKHPENGLMHQ